MTLVPKLLTTTKQTYPFLKNLRCEVTVKDDTWNGFKNSEYNYLYFEGNDVIASTTFRSAVGQIGWICAKDHHTRLREEILFDIVDKMTRERTPPKTVWEACVSEDDPLYKKWGFTWRQPVHHTVTGNGWSTSLNQLILNFWTLKSQTVDRRSPTFRSFSLY